MTCVLHSDPISLARLLAASTEGPDGRTLLAAAGLSEAFLPVLFHPTSRVGTVQADLGGPSSRTVILIIHNMRDVIALADRAIILSNGHKLADMPLAGVTTGQLRQRVMGAADPTAR